jgi:hypothetical protein
VEGGGFVFGGGGFALGVLGFIFAMAALGKIRRLEERLKKAGVLE